MLLFALLPSLAAIHFVDHFEVNFATRFVRFVNRSEHFAASFRRFIARFVVRSNRLQKLTLTDFPIELLPSPLPLPLLLADRPFLTSVDPLAFRFLHACFGDHPGQFSEYPQLTELGCFPFALHWMRWASLIQRRQAVQAQCGLQVLQQVLARRLLGQPARVFGHDGCAALSFRSESFAQFPRGLERGGKGSHPMGSGQLSFLFGFHPNLPNCFYQKC